MRFLYQDARLDRADRIQLYISYALRLILLAEGVLALVQGSLLTAFLSGGILLLTLVPAFIRNSYRVYLPIEFDLLTVLFVFASLFLGESRSYYERFWWWGRPAPHLSRTSDRLARLYPRLRPQP